MNILTDEPIEQIGGKFAKTSHYRGLIALVPLKVVFIEDQHRVREHDRRERRVSVSVEGVESLIQVSDATPAHHEFAEAKDVNVQEVFAWQCCGASVRHHRYAGTMSLRNTVTLGITELSNSRRQILRSNLSLRRLNASRLRLR